MRFIVSRLAGLSRSLMRGTINSMRKRIVELRDTRLPAESDAGWLNLSEIATVEVTSEDERFPIETVFAGHSGPGWRAARPGKQILRIIFDEPVAVRRIRLRFDEPESERTHEFTLSWCSAAGTCKEIVRQSWNFNESATTEIEDYQVNLDGVATLEVAIRPDITDNDGFATLSSWLVWGTGN
jgi:hypothetical protein